MNENNKNNIIKNLKSKGIAVLLSATTFLGGLGLGIGATQAKANAILRENENNNAESIELAQKENEIAALENSINSLNAQVSVLQEYVNELKNINAEDAKTIQAHLDTIKALGAVVNSSNDASATWAKYAQEYKDKIEELTKALSEQYKNSEELKEAIANLKSQVSDYKANEGSLQDKISSLQQTIKELNDELLSQGQKPEEPATPTIKSFETSFNKVLETERNSDNAAYYDTQIKKLANEAELAYLSGNLSHDEVIALFESIKLSLDPNFYENKGYQFYLANYLDDKQFDILFNVINENISKVDDKSNGFSVEMSINNQQEGLFIVGESNNEKVAYYKSGLSEEEMYAHEDKSGNQQASYNGEYITHSPSDSTTSSNTNPDMSETVSKSQEILEQVLNSFTTANVIGEYSECFLNDNKNRDVTPLGNGSYSIDTILEEDGVKYTITATLTPNKQGGYDYILSATDGKDSTVVKNIWGQISQKEFEEIKTSTLSAIEQAKTNDSTLGE